MEAPIYLFTGPEFGKRNDAVDSVKKALVKKVGNPYKLAVIVSKRAKTLQQSLTEQEREEVPEVTRAVNDVYTGKIISK